MYKLKVPDITESLYSKVEVQISQIFLVLGLLYLGFLRGFLLSFFFF